MEFTITTLSIQLHVVQLVLHVPLHFPQTLANIPVTEAYIHIYVLRKLCAMCSDNRGWLSS